MPNVRLQQEPRSGTCRLCREPCENTGFGWYHSGRPLGTVHGVRPHFACPIVRAA
jgi:hypothetical protein